MLNRDPRSIVMSIVLFAGVIGAAVVADATGTARAACRKGDQIAPDGRCFHNGQPTGAHARNGPPPPSQPDPCHEPPPGQEQPAPTPELDCSDH
jgi:hypothetical protein